MQLTFAIGGAAFVVLKALGLWRKSHRRTSSQDDDEEDDDEDATKRAAKDLSGEDGEDE